MIFRKNQGKIIAAALAGTILLLGMTSCSMQKNAENTGTVALENAPVETGTIENQITESQITGNRNEAEEPKSETVAEMPVSRETEDAVGQEQKVTNPEPAASGKETEPATSDPIEY